MLIHVGYHKTGTTWLQRTLFSARETGFVPIDGEPKAFGWRFIHGTHHLPSSLQFDAAEVRAAYDAFGFPRGSCPVISNEDLLSHIWSGGVQAHDIAHKLKTTFPEAKILITIREQTKLIKSAYAHYICRGGICGISNFIKSYNEYQIPLFNVHFLKFHNTIRLYQHLFGWQNVLVMPAEFLANDPVHSLQSIASFCKVKPSTSALNRLARVEHLNQGEHNATAFYYLAPWINLLLDRSNNNARTALGFRGARQLLNYTATWIPKKVVHHAHEQMSSEITRSLGSYYATSNGRTAKLTGLPLQDLGYSVN